MAETPSNVPTKSIFDDEDDNEDLFQSAVQSNPKSAVNTSTSEVLASSTPINGDMLVTPVVEEINLLEEEDDKASTEVLKPLESSTPSPATMLPSSYSSCSPPLSTSPNPEASITPVLASSHSMDMGTVAKSLASMDLLKPTGNPQIEVKVDKPRRCGDGMGAYILYKVTTNTSLPYFRRQSFSVERRFSDFLGLREKLADKYLHQGRLVPPAPEKDAYNNTRLLMSKDDSTVDDFLERRSAALERFVNRVAAHEVLVADPDFREFLELETELPRAKNTSALSGASVKRLLSRVGDTVNKMTFKMDETNQWFEEKQHQIDSLDQQLRKLHASVEALIHHRRELTATTGVFAKSAAMLGNCEEHNSLSCALSQLAETEEKVEQLYGQQTNSDFYYLSELMKDYIGLIAVVKDVFHHRVKVYQTYAHAQQMLNRKREMRQRYEHGGREDKLSTADEEIAEWDAKVKRGDEEFRNITETIRKELERFELNRLRDFKINIVKYMESLLNTQQQLIKYWEAFLPEAKAIA